MKVKEYAEKMNVSRRTIINWIKRGFVQAEKSPPNLQTSAWIIKSAVGQLRAAPLPMATTTTPPPPIAASLPIPPKPEPRYVPLEEERPTAAELERRRERARNLGIRVIDDDF